MDHMVWLDTTWAWHSAVHTEMRAVQLEMPCDNQWTSWTSRKKNKPARSRLDHFLHCWLFLCCGYCCLSVAGLGTIRVLLGFVSLCYIFNASQQFSLPHNNNGRLRKKCHLSTANKSFRNKWATKVFFFLEICMILWDMRDSWGSHCFPRISKHTRWAAQNRLCGKGIKLIVYWSLSFHLSIIYLSFFHFWW